MCHSSRNIVMKCLSGSRWVFIKCCNTITNTYICIEDCMSVKKNILAVICSAFFCYEELVVYCFNKFIIIFFFILQRAIGSTGGKSIAHVIEVLEGC